MVLKNSEITPEDVQKLVEICNELEIGFKVTSEHIEVSTFESGAVSNIYQVTFTSSNTPTSTPPSLVIKLYQVHEKLPYDITTSQLNNLFVGQSGLGPKVLLIRKDSIVWEYLSVRGLSTDDDHDLDCREQIARKLAHFHSMRVPIARNTHEGVVKHIFDDWFEDAWLDALKTDGHQLKEAALKKDCTTLLDPQMNLKTELDFIRNTILAIQNPKIVFSHCDFNHSNILVQEDKKVCFIDFDFSGYFYRGADLGRYFADCTHSESWDDNTIMSDDEMLQFITWYREESLNIPSQYSCTPENPKDSVEEILKESKLFVLYSHFVDLIFCLFMAWNKKDEDQEKMEEFVDFVEKRFRGYLRTKGRFQADGSIAKN